MVTFSIETPPSEVDLALTDITRLDQIGPLMKQLMQVKPQGAIIHVALFPPLTGKLSIPLAFKEIMAYHPALAEKELQLTVYLKHEQVKDYLIKYLPEADQPQISYQVGAVKVSVQLGDITKAHTQAIVNASNNTLKLGGGVSGAIREAANPDIQLQLDRIAKTKEIQAGDAIVTGAFGLKGTEFIIHASSVEGTETVIKLCMQNILLASEKHHIKQLAIPALGAGTGGLQMQTCATLMIQEIIAFYQAQPAPQLTELKLLLWRKKDYDTFVEVIDRLNTL